MKVILTENQYRRIFLKEQSNRVLEKIKGSFSTNNADSAHNFQEMEDKIGISLDKFYKQGINPKISKVSATISGKGSNFTSNYSAEIIDNGSGDAWTGFFSRGSIGSNHQSRAKSQRYEKDPHNKVKKNSTIEERLIIFKNAERFEDIPPSPIHGTNPPFTQYFVQFTKTNKPLHSSTPKESDGEVEIDSHEIRDLIYKDYIEDIKANEELKQAKEKEIKIEKEIEQATDEVDKKRKEEELKISQEERKKAEEEAKIKAARKVTKGKGSTDNMWAREYPDYYNK